MEHVLAFAAETKASSLIRLIKNDSKILNLLQFEKFQLINPDFFSFLRKSKALNTLFFFYNEAENKI